MAGAAEFGRYGRRIVKLIWDPEPTNDPSANLPVWCLGCSYTHDSASPRTLPASEDTPETSHDDTTKASGAIPTNAPDTPPDSVSSSFSSSLAYDDLGQDGGWPTAFLDDFESRIWMTYRSGFEIIPKSTDPKATYALSFAMRLKTLGDQSGFSSDSGWGCMIRSGQSLLANALSACYLGRGKSNITYPPNLLGG